MSKTQEQSIRTHIRDLAKIESKKARFLKAPKTYSFCAITITIIKCLAWLFVAYMLIQWKCHNCLIIHI